MARKNVSEKVDSRGTVSVGRVLTQIMARKGFTRQSADEEMERVWTEAVGEFIARQSRLGILSHGTIEIFVRNAIVSQELSFRVPKLMKTLNSVTVDKKIKKIKFTVADF